MLIIPAIDILDSRVVRLTRGDYTTACAYDCEPVEVFRRWARAGARRIHLVFLSAAREGFRRREEDPILRALLTEKERLDVEVQIGGGIRTIDEVERLFQWGVDYAILGTAVVLDIIRIQEEKQRLDYGGPLADFLREVNLPVSGIIREILDRELAGKVIPGLDSRAGSVAVSGWEITLPPSPRALAAAFSELGFHQCVYTCADRDGTLAGPDIEGVRAVSEAASETRLIVAGGIGGLDDIAAVAALKRPNIQGVIAGKALYENRLDLAEAISRFQA